MNTQSQGAPAPATSHTNNLINRRSFPPRPADITDLPFVANVKVAPRKTELCFWSVPPTDDYGHACDVGRQYACDFVQYLKQNSFWVGSGNLGWLVEDMHKYADTPEEGYAVGFFAFLEQLLYVAATHTDHYVLAEKDAQRYAAIKADREVEEENNYV